MNIFDLMVNIINFSKIKFITISISFSTLFISVIVTVPSKLVDKIPYKKESCRPFNLSFICLYSNNDQLVLIRFQCSTFYRVSFEISFSRKKLCIASIVIIAIQSSYGNKESTVYLVPY